MKRVLITGEHGYIGRCLGEYLAIRPEEYEIDFLGLRDDHWRQADLSGYDAIIHAAALVHQRETPENTALYYKVNRDLTIELAKKAKAEGVRHFVFLSSGSVYGKLEGVITRDTEPSPVTNYGKSKLEAEEALISMKSQEFAVAILRPLMVYGDGCKGNYQMLEKLARIVPVLPTYENRRSLVSVDTLCAYMKDVIDRRSRGIFFPQDKEDVCTCALIQRIAERQGRKLRRIKILDPAVKLFCLTTDLGKKAFGNLVYQKLDVLPFDS